MEFKSYIESNKIPDKYILSLVDSEIECWGSKPFDEYRVCNNENCKSIYSIEDIFGTVLNYRLLKGTKEFIKLEDNFKCEKCNSETSLIYEKNIYLNDIFEYFKKEVTTVLLLNNDVVEGFGVLNKGTLGSILFDDLDYRPNSWDISKVIKKISNLVYNIDDASDNDFIYSSKIYVSPDFRKGNTTIDLLKHLFSLNDSFKGTPIIAETRYDSKFYPVTRIMGYKDIEFDKYGSVLQYKENYNDVLEILLKCNSFTEKSVMSELIKFKRESQQILKENPHFIGRKYYI